MDEEADKGCNAKGPEHHARLGVRLRQGCNAKGPKRCSMIGGRRREALRRALNAVHA
jgi:hypothetical protein